MFADLNKKSVWFNAATVINVTVLQNTKGLING